MTLVTSMPKSLDADMRYGAPVLYWIAVSFIAAFVLCSALGLVDARLFNGVSVWEKPAKFFLSLSVHAATLGWGVLLMPESQRGSKGVRWAAILFSGAAVGEMLWITFQGARGAASHFNQTDPLAMALYPLMGLGPLTLTATTIYLGWRILRSGKSVMSHATGIGFIVSGILTTLVAGYMAQKTGHSIGGDQSDASGLAFFHWSTTGGDLRVSHFAALHVAQALPFLAWIWPDRRIVAIGALVSVIMVAALFIQALAGIPFLRA